MTRELAFVQVDVFTERVFNGNPLAVFLDGRGLDDGEMQAIAREMNLSETTFVLPTTRADCAARDRTAVDRAALDVTAMRRAAGDPLPGVFVFCAEDTGAYSRMFAPHTSRIAEDPATGSASGPLGAYLVLHGLVTGGGAVHLVSE